MCIHFSKKFYCIETFTVAWLLSILLTFRLHFCSIAAIVVATVAAAASFSTKRFLLNQRSVKKHFIYYNFARDRKLNSEKNLYSWGLGYRCAQCCTIGVAVRTQTNAYIHSICNDGISSTFVYRFNCLANN